jgi:hypothetical protein
MVCSTVTSPGSTIMLYHTSQVLPTYPESWFVMLVSQPGAVYTNLHQQRLTLVIGCIRLSDYCTSVRNLPRQRPENRATIRKTSLRDEDTSHLVHSTFFAHRKFTVQHDHLFEAQLSLLLKQECSDLTFGKFASSSKTGSLACSAWRFRCLRN